MSFGSIVGIFTAIVGVAMAWVLVTHTQTAKIISAIGDAFKGALRASMGN